MGMPEDLKMLYDKQRAFREANPVADFGLNFIPFAGTVAAVDDVANSMAAKKYGQAALDAVGLIPGGKLLKKGVQGMDAIDTAVRSYMVRSGNSHMANGASILTNLLGYGTATVGAGIASEQLIDKQLNPERYAK